jgi:agmatinase
MNNPELNNPIRNNVEVNGNVGQVSGMEVPRFGGHSTFARLPRIEDVSKYDVAILGAPFDAGVSYRPGARFGPAHVRQASRLLRPYNPAQDVSPFAKLQVVDAGDAIMNPFNIQEALVGLEKHSAILIEKGKPLFTIGGDHTIALALLRSLNKVYGQIALVHFDAHLDTWDTYMNASYTHGTPFRRAWEEKLLIQDKCMHVGIRGPLYDKTDLVNDKKFGFGIVSSTDFNNQSLDEIISKVKSRVGDAPVYISIDIDVLDPGFAPGTGTPEMGGLSSRELLAIVRGLKDTHLVGADVVEVAPAYDHAEITGIAASHLIYEMISIVASKN